MSDSVTTIRFNWKDAFKYFIKVLISFSILGLCFRLIDLEGFKQAILSVDLFFYAIAVFVTIIASIVMPALVTLTAQQTGRLSFSIIELIIINFCVRLYTIVLPRAMATGMRFIKYRKFSAGKDALVIIVFEKIAQMAIIMTFASVFLLIESNKQNLGQNNTLLVILTIFLNVICIFAFSVFFSERLSTILSRFVKYFYFLFPVAIQNKINSLWDAVRAFQNLNRKDILACLFYSAISYALFILAPYIIAKAMGLDITIYALGWMRALIMVLALVPVTVAGLGVREAGFIAFLELYNVPHSTALAFSLLLFFQHILIALVGLVHEFWVYLIRPIITQSQ